jgi:hypothetical protein
LTALAPPDKPSSKRNSFFAAIAIVTVLFVTILALVGQTVAFSEQVPIAARFTIRTQLVVVASLA